MTFERVQLRRFVESACDGPFGSAIKSDHYVEEGVRVVRLGNIGQVEWEDGDAAYLDPVYAAGLERHRVDAGDLLVAGLGDVNNPVGRACVAPASIGPAIVKADCYRLRLRGMNPQFVAYYLSSASGLAESWMVADGSTRQRLTLGKALGLRVPVPSAAEQRAIADYLDTETARIDALIAKKRQMIDLLDEAWSGEIVERTVGRPGRVALRRLVVPPIGGTWGGPAGEFEVEAVCIRGADFDTRRLSVDVESAPTRSFQPSDYKSKALDPGDLIIEKSGGGENQPVGRVVEWTGSGRAVPTNFAARLRPNRGVHSRWLCYTLRGAYEVGLTRSWIKQTTGIQNLDLGGFLSEQVSVPEPAEQAATSELLDRRLDSFQRADQAIENQLALLMEHRQALITAAVTGEMRVPGVAA